MRGVVHLPRLLTTSPFSSSTSPTTSSPLNHTAAATAPERRRVVIHASVDSAVTVPVTVSEPIPVSVSSYIRNDHIFL